MVKEVAINVCSSAIPDRDDFLKSLFAQPAGKSAFNFSEPSLSILSG